MAVLITRGHRHSLLLPAAPGRRVATWSLLMVAATMAATVAAWIVGSFVQSVVLGLEEEQLLTDAGVWGYVASLFIFGLMALPALAGIVLGVRARRLGERRLGAAGIVANGLIGMYLLTTTVANLLIG